MSYVWLYIAPFLTEQFINKEIVNTTIQPFPKMMAIEMISCSLYFFGSDDLIVTVQGKTEFVHKCLNPTCSRNGKEHGKGKIEKGVFWIRLCL